MNIFNKIKKSQFKHTVISVLFLFSMAGSAYGGEETGLIVDLYVRSYDGLVFVNLDGTPTNKPSCSTSRSWMIKSEETTTGKSQFAMLLSAKLNKKPVHIIGTNGCTRWLAAEDINYAILPYSSQ